tara:strand:+ start:1214 stop:2047 length:834 start_codon:yes stop_codon:yes gene_type:complete
MFQEFIKNILFNIKKKKYIFSPVFIIACGRSGTTILGETLSLHPKIKYLNERRDLWHKAYSNFDIWNKNTQNPKIFANEKDIVSKQNNILQDLFFREQVLGSATILLEKLPINNFRLNFLNASFPNARYIYLTRNGLEVSKSIEKKIVKNNWYTGSKYNLLKKYAMLNNIDFSPTNNFEKGLWEWKLSITESNNFFKKMNQNKFIHLSYQDLIENPNNNLEKIFHFLEIEKDENLIQKISLKIKRNSPKENEISNDRIKKIGGKILEKTINNTYAPF